MTQYTTTTPGDIRRRTRYIGIWTPPDLRTFAAQASDPAGAPLPTVQVLEQNLVRLADREGMPQDLGDLPGTQFKPSNEFPLRDPQTDAIIPGQTATDAQVMTLIYSWVRSKQDARDAQEPQS